jgi:hypothetical protein
VLDVAEIEDAKTSRDAVMRVAQTTNKQPRHRDRVQTRWWCRNRDNGGMLQRISIIQRLFDGKMKIITKTVGSLGPSREVERCVAYAPVGGLQGWPMAGVLLSFACTEEPGALVWGCLSLPHPPGA